MNPVELCSISLHYDLSEGRSIEVASSLSISLVEGQISCLAGRSGSGKTSILSVAAGLLAPDTGQVMWFGEDVAKMSDSQRALSRRSRIGYMDQGADLLDGLTTLENVLVPAIPTGKARSLRGRAESLLRTLGLSSRLRQPPAKLSGGERQRVALARALLMSPQVLIVDEPTASLDRSTADAVISLLKDEASKGSSVLVASHDPKLIEAASDVIRLES